MCGRWSDTPSNLVIESYDTCVCVCVRGQWVYPSLEIKVKSGA